MYSVSPGTVANLPIFPALSRFYGPQKPLFAACGSHIGQHLPIEILPLVTAVNNLETWLDQATAKKISWARP